MLAPKNILVATDFSESSATALTYGRAFAHAFGARLHVLHVVEMFSVDSAILGTAASAIPTIQLELEQAAKHTLEELVTAEDRRELHAVTALRSVDTPAAAIVDYSKDHKIDLIIVGTHGRRGFSHALLGSVAEKVVRMAPCPVLTVRERQREFVAPDALMRSIERPAGDKA